MAQIKLKISVRYRGVWHYAKHLTINEDGSLYIQYLYGLDGAVDQDHVEKVVIEHGTN